MALILNSFDDFYHPIDRYSIIPNRRNFLNNNVFSSILSDRLYELQQLERELGQFQKVDDSNELNFCCNVAGYNPDELTVDLEGDEIVIKGEHKQSSKGQSVHRTFIRSVTVPKNINKESIKCNIGEKGRLELTAQPNDVPIKQKQNIPIGFKQSLPNVAKNQIQDNKEPNSQ